MTIKFDGISATAEQLANFRQDIGVGSAVKPLSDYFTRAEWALILANNYSTTLTSTRVTDQLELAFAEAEGKWFLTWPGNAYLKVNRPVRFYGRLHAGPLAANMYSFGCIYPDLSVDWRTTYPNRGVIESANYQYPTLPPGKASWPGSKPDFIAPSRLMNIEIRCAQDSLYAANKNRVPYYGFVLHAPNEMFVMEGCYTTNAGVAGIFYSGYQSSPTAYNCGGFNNGKDQDTLFGATVTRTTGGAFSNPVYVWSGTNAVAGPDIYLEAAGSTDLSSIAGGNVLQINGVDRTVSSVGSVQTVNERTVISGSVTSTRSVLRVTFSSNVPAYTQGRYIPTGLKIGTHPSGASFASGVSAADGGQGDGGLVVLHNFSGDYQTALIHRLGRYIVNAYGTKAENNGSVFRADCNGENGGDDGTTMFVGYRCDQAAIGNQGVFRFVGWLGRPTLFCWGKTPGTGAQTNIVEYYGDSTVGNVTNHGNGRGPIYWNGDSNRISYWAGVQMWDKRVLVDSLHLNQTPTTETITPNKTFTMVVNGVTVKVPCL